MNTQTTIPTLTTDELHRVVDMIRSTGRKGATLDQVVRFVERAAGISGSRAGYDAPWTRESVDAAALGAWGHAVMLGANVWTTGARTAQTTNRVGFRAAR